MQKPDHRLLNVPDTLDDLLIEGIDKQLRQKGCMSLHELVAALVPNPDEKKFAEPDMRRRYVGVISALLDDLKLGGEIPPVRALRQCKAALEQMSVKGAFLEQLRMHNANQVGMYVSSM